MSTKQVPQQDELRMKADDFDRIMRAALGVAAPLVESKAKATPKKRPPAKNVKKRA